MLNSLFDSSFLLITFIIRIFPISNLCFGGSGDTSQSFLVSILLLSFKKVIFFIGVHPIKNKQRIRVVIDNA